VSIFYAVVEGDPLTSGGNSRVIEGVPHSTIEGPDGRPRNQTLVGQKAWCDACKSTGVIAPAPGSPDTLRERFHFVDYRGQEALGGDLVICKCEQHPQVISIYGRTVMIVDTGDGTNSANLAASHQFDELLRAVGDGATEDYPYYVETSDGRTFTGRLGSDGALPRVTTAAADDYRVYWGDEALAKQEGV
jgi:hypothetical protein